MIFGNNYPDGPCPENWDKCECSCGWKYNADEVIFEDCEDGCETCDYCGNEKCPKCKEHLHCGGCI